MKKWNAVQLLDVIVNGPDEDTAAALDVAQEFLRLHYPAKAGAGDLNPKGRLTQPAPAVSVKAP